MAEENGNLPHKLTLDERKQLTLTGARSVLHFDEEMAQLDTSRGMVVVHGRELKLRTLSLEGGKVAITGHICAIIYEESGRRRRFGGLLG